VLWEKRERNNRTTKVSRTANNVTTKVQRTANNVTTKVQRTATYCRRKQRAKYYKQCDKKGQSTAKNVTKKGKVLEKK